MSISHLLDIGRSALQAAQFGLDVTANNIANVNTPGYTRQRAVQAAHEPISIGKYIRGSGVAIEGAERIYDAFLGRQVINANSEMNDYQLREQTYSRIESILYPSEDSNLGTLIDEFFNSWQDLANNPVGTVERQMVLTRAEELASNLNYLHGSLEEEIRHTNTVLEEHRDEVNRLASEIALLNKEIGRVENHGVAPNTLLDQRDALIQELAGYVDVNMIENQGGMVTVLVSGGQPLVDGTSSFTLDLIEDPDDHGFYRLSIRGTDITDSLEAGKMKGVVESRQKIVEFQDELNRLAAEFTREFNRLHTAGYDLDANLGLDFFAPLDANVVALSANQGGADVSLQEIIDPSLLTLDDYEIRFTDSSNYQIINTNQDTVVSTGTYTSGANIEFEGIRVALSNQTGPPAAGDTFRVSVTEDAAHMIQVNIQDTDQIAAAQDPNALPGDNRNALALAALRNETVVDGGSTTFSGFYQSLIGKVGSEVQNATRKAEAGEAVYEAAVDYRNGVSGVSLEEEELRLLAYQHAYQAAARFMTVVEELMDTLIHM